MDEIVQVPLDNGEFAIIDAEDAERILPYKWSAQLRPNGKFYARRSEGGKIIMMHREIAGTEKGLDTDHWDKDSLNNRRKNLRPCTRSLNSMNRGRQSNNTTGYKGVTVARDKRKNKYQAQIVINGKQTFIGLFYGPYAAAIAYDEVALATYGDFAELNFPL